jgi:hypothetical protein
MDVPLILLAGVPASGKSHFGRWLEEQHGVLHLDVEEAGRLAALGLESSWNRCFQAGDPTLFVAQVKSLDRPTVVNWGFPIHCLSVVRRFKAAGIVLWWFDADPSQARREFISRGGVPLVAFERQIAAIAAAWNEIESVFRPNLVTTLDSSGRRAELEELRVRILPRSRPMAGG